MSEEAVKWVLQEGDRYAPVFGDWFMVDGGAPRHAWRQLAPLSHSHDQAVRAGLAEQDSDDFNIVVVRDGRVVALLWMDQDIQEEARVLLELEQLLGLVVKLG